MADPSCTECEAKVITMLVNEAEPLQTTENKYNPLDPSTFAPPPLLPPAHITIQFCNRCRWLHRATWVSTELFVTFPLTILHGIHILPLDTEETAGVFRVWLSRPQTPSETKDGVPARRESPSEALLVWDRKIEGGFPELKVLKQRIRDHLQPGMKLGHSDKTHSDSKEEKSVDKRDADVGTKEAQQNLYIQGRKAQAIVEV